MKILHANFGLLQGGIDNMLMDLMKYQVQMGHQVCLLVINNVINENILSFLPQGVKLYIMGRPESSKNPFYVLKTTYYINKIIKPDIIHCHNGDLGFFLIFDKHPKVLTVHAMSLPTKRYRYFDYLCCISKAVQADVLKSYHTKSISVVYNSVDDNAISHKNKIQRGPSFDIITVGRLNHKDKGQDIVIKALALLKGRGYHFRLSLVGDGKSYDYLRSLTIQLGISEDVIFVGEKRKDWIYEHLCDFDLMVVPSRHEGFGLSILEGVFAGIPVVVSNIDGPKELVENGKYCFIFNSEDENSLANVILKIYEMRLEDLNQKIERDCIHFKNLYSCEVMSRSYFDIYNKVLNLSVY